MKFFSAIHILTILLEIGFVYVLYRAFRDRSARAKRAVIVTLMALNIVQHLFKHLIYPHLRATPPGIDVTLYNACALLILLSPFLHFGKSNTARQFLAYVGSIAGFIAVIVPFWFFGSDILDPDVLSEYIRFWVCHALLLASSFLPVLWRGVRFCYLDGRKFAFLFLGMLCILLLNNVIALHAAGTKPSELYEGLVDLNPLGIMGPPANDSPFNALIAAVEVLSPSLFLGGNGKSPLPILWYAFPVGIGVTLIGLLLGAGFDHENFFADMKLLFLRKFTPPKRKKLTRRDYGHVSDRLTVF